MSVQYRRAVLSYIDVLGFRELVRSQSAAEIGEILERFESQASPYLAADTRGHSHLAFSDTIVRVALLDSSDSSSEILERLHLEAADIAAAQAVLSQRGVFIRGALTVGDLVVASARIYGPGLIRAYELEKSLAKYPRVIVDPTVWTALAEEDLSEEEVPDYSETEFRPVTGYFCMDEDIVFVDYLRVMTRLGRQELTQDTLAEEGLFFRNHRKAILRGLQATDKGVKEKYEWLGDYHNFRVLISDDALLV